MTATFNPIINTSGIRLEFQCSPSAISSFVSWPSDRSNCLAFHVANSSNKSLERYKYRNSATTDNSR